MPKIKTSRSKKAPEGYELIEETLEELNQKMRAGKHPFRYMLLLG
jgi:hypothetical protein